MFRFSSAPSINELRANSRKFVYGMGWDKYQAPRSLMLALIGELGELVTDAKQEKPTQTLEEDIDNLNMCNKRPKTQDTRLRELEDVCSYMYRLADECSVDLGSLDTSRNNKQTNFKDFAFTDRTWDDLEITGFYQVDLKEGDTLLQDVFKLILSVSNVCDVIQWCVVEQGMTNVSLKKRSQLDKVLKDACCHMLVLASKHEFDLPYEVDKKDKSVAKKYPSNELSKDAVFTKRYSHLQYYRTVERKFKAAVYLTDGNKCKDSVKECLARLVEAIGLVCEVFQWEGEVDVGLVEFCNVKHAHLSDKLKDIFQAIYNLSLRFSINLSSAFLQKMEKNAEKYPVNLVKGDSTKYNELPDTLLEESSETSVNLSSENFPTPPSAKSSLENLSFEQVRLIMDEFVSEREWRQYHTPRNLTFALFGEIGEVLELFVKFSEPDTSLLADELADCLAYLVRLADVSSVDLAAVVSAHKLPTVFF